MNPASIVLLVLSIGLYSALFIIMVVRKNYWVHYFKTKLEFFKRALDYFFFFQSAYVVRLLVSQFKIEILTLLSDAVMCVFCVLLIYKLFSNIRHVVLEAS